MVINNTLYRWENHTIVIAVHKSMNTYMNIGPKVFL